MIRGIRIWNICREAETIRRTRDWKFTADFRFYKQANWWSSEYLVLVTQPYTHVHWNMNRHLSAVERKVSIYVAFLPSSCCACKLHDVEPWSLGAADIRCYQQTNWSSSEYWVSVTQPYTHVHWNMNWHLSTVERKVSIYLRGIPSRLMTCMHVVEPWSLGAADFRRLFMLLHICILHCFYILC